MRFMIHSTRKLTKQDHRKTEKIQIPTGIVSSLRGDDNDQVSMPVFTYFKNQNKFVRTDFQTSFKMHLYLPV